jgi:3-methyladenine DNA glycosylase AlkC
MAEPLKNLYHPALIIALSQALKNTYNPFKSEAFYQAVFTSEWTNKALKQRMRHITRCLHQFLPDNYLKTINILKSIATDFNGFQYMFFADYVAIYGLNHYQQSIAALEQFTQSASAEFAVRVLIEHSPDKMMAQMACWSQSDNLHLRRLASEGCRPRLPWAKSLTIFKNNPQAIFTILENLKQDQSDYVRRSVANNLNDISKDHPQLVITRAKTWFGQHQYTDWIVKHGCRSLLKQANPEIMTLFGFDIPQHIEVKQFVVQKQVTIDDRLHFSVSLHTQKTWLGRLRIEYAIDFMKKNGQLSRKIFKLSESTVRDATKDIAKKHSFKTISTRKYYPGIHGIILIVNGHPLAQSTFQLHLKSSAR